MFKSSIIRINKPDIVIVLFMLFNFGIHFAFAGNLEYHRDELLYFSLGMHPGFGYMTVPPMIGWISWLIQNIFGYSVYAVRIFPAMLSALMILLVSSTARGLGGSAYASGLAALGLTVSVFFMRSFSLFHPVHIEIFLWTLCIWIIVRYINTKNDRYLLFLGIAAGFALLTKYLAVLLFTALFLVIPFTVHNEVFRKRAFWFGFAAGTLIFLPNLIWQALRSFPVFSHMGELFDTQLVHMDIPLFLNEQLMMPFAGSLFTAAGLLYLLFSREALRFRFLGLAALLIITSLMMLRGKGYYTLGVFPMLIAAGGVAWGNILKRRALRIVFPLIVAAVTVPVIPMGIPVLKQKALREYFRVLDQELGIDAGRRFEDGTIHSLPQDYADMLGWEELTALTDSAYRLIDDKEGSFIYAENYGQAGAITVIGRKYGLPQAISFHESFRYWIPMDFERNITSGIYINDELGEDVEKLFGRIIRIGSISDPDAREYGTTVWLCLEPVSSFNSFWKRRISELDNDN